MDIHETLKELVAAAQKREHEKRIETQVQILSALYDKAAIYANVIMVAGYASFFTVWAFMKDTLSEIEMLLSAITVSASLVFFVFWEVGKMIFHATHFRSFAKVLEVPQGQFEEKLKEFQMGEQRLNICIHRFWIAVLVLTILPGLIGAGTLFYSFLRQLFFGESGT